MKNTLITLDIIYLDDNKTIVSIIENAKPLDETSLPSGSPAKYVLEIMVAYLNNLILKLAIK